MAAAKTRIRMRCLEISRTPATVIDPKYRKVYDEEGLEAARAAADADGKADAHIEVEQPTVTFGIPSELDGEENRKLWPDAPRQAGLSMTIANPEAHDLFELGADYLVDLQRAPAKKE
jgi:hypothetical protein